MAEADITSGFPTGEIIFRSSDEQLIERIQKITDKLLERPEDHEPYVTYERHELYMAAPDDNEQIATALYWPMTAKQYEAFWHPTPSTQPPSVVIEQTVPEPSPLDIFKPLVEHDEVDEEQNRLAVLEQRTKDARDRLAVRLGVVSAILSELPDDSFIQDYIDSHGIFDREQGQHIPLGFNLDGIDRNLFYRNGSSLQRVFNIMDSSRQSAGSISTITSRRSSLIGGLMTDSGTNRADWEDKLREDVSYLATRLQEVPHHYLDLFDGRGYLLVGESSYATERQIGTKALREFFSGYYQFAPEGVTLLRAEKRKNLFGAVEHDEQHAISSISSIYVALKHELASRSHLVRLRAIDSDEPEESKAELHVFEYPEPLDGQMLRHRIGGYYGEMDQDPEQSVARMGDTLRSTIDPAILELIKNGTPVGTEITGFSHKDFYAVVEFLSAMALSKIEY
jgi:hypothetical protein